MTWPKSSRGSESLGSSQCSWGSSSRKQRIRAGSTLGSMVQSRFGFKRGRFREKSVPVIAMRATRQCSCQSRHGTMGGTAIWLYIAADGTSNEAIVMARNNAFTLLALSPLIHAFSCRSSTNSILSFRPVFALPVILAVVISTGIHLVAVLIPALRPVFKTHNMTGDEWLQVLVLSALIVPAMELFKLGYRLVRKGSRATANV